MTLGTNTRSHHQHLRSSDDAAAAIHFRHATLRGCAGANGSNAAETVIPRRNLSALIG